jgi:hypothetical protein
MIGDVWVFRVKPGVSRMLAGKRMDFQGKAVISWPEQGSPLLGHLPAIYYLFHLWYPIDRSNHYQGQHYPSTVVIFNHNSIPFTFAEIMTTFFAISGFK